MKSRSNFLCPHDKWILCIFNLSQCFLPQQKWGKSGKCLKKMSSSAQHANIVTPLADAECVGKWAVNTTGLGTI